MNEIDIDKKLTCVNSIFEQPWWLDAVAPGRWRSIEIKNGENVVARLPYVFIRKYGIKMIGMPSNTQTLGIYFEDTGAKLPNKLGKQKSLINAVIDQLPKRYSIDMALDHRCHYILPFIWSGFRIRPCFSYRMRCLEDIEKIWSGMRENIRREIRKATKILQIRDDLSIDVLIEMVKKTFQRQGRLVQDRSEFLKRLDKAALKHNARKLICAVDKNGNVHAAGYFVYDEKTCYYLIGRGDPELRNSGASSLVLWEGIKFASTVSEAFDFEGSMIEDIERFFRAFGGEPTVYYRVTRLNPALSFLDYIKPWVKKIIGYK